MKRRVVDELYVYMRRLVILAICVQLFSTSARTCKPIKSRINITNLQFPCLRDEDERPT